MSWRRLWRAPLLFDPPHAIALMASIDLDVQIAADVLDQMNVGRSTLRALQRGHWEAPF